MTIPDDDTNIHNLFEPRPAEMLAHAEHLFGGYLGGCHDGLIELAWTDTTTRALRHARLYGTDQLDELVAHAVSLNSQSGCNVYLGAALRKPDTAVFGRASDADFLALTCAYVDLDEPGAATTAKDKYRTDKPTKVVVTGQTPHPRAQLWWRLDEPIVDPRLAEALLKGLAVGLSGDPTVTNASRVMRLGGSVAWPIKPGRVTEMTSLITPREPLARSYSWERLARLFPPPQPASAPPGLEQAAPARVVETGGVVRGVTALGLEGGVIDGREGYMLKTISACLAQLVGEAGAAPTAQALHNLAWPQFSRPPNDISRPRANGQPWTAEAFMDKCVYALKRFAEGKIPGMRTMDEARTIHAQKQAAYEARGGKGRYYDPVDDFGPGQAKADPGKRFEYLNMAAIESAPDPVWLIEGLVVEQSLGFVYGPPGSLKSFMCLDIALSMTTKQSSWWGYGISKPGAVIYICAEGHAFFKYRIAAWRTHRGVATTDTPFFLIKQSINFMRPEDIGALLATVEDIVAEAGQPIAAIFVDTVSKVLPGAEENQQKDMTVFVAACAAVRERYECVVVGVHHTNKQGGFRGSSVIPAAGDFIIETRREPGAMTGSIYVHKVKDGEDGWERAFAVKKIELPMGRSSLAVDGTDDDPSAPEAEDNARGWPPLHVRHEILAALSEQWFKKQPWGATANSARPALRLIMSRWQLKRKSVQDLLDFWVANDVIAEEILDGKKRIKGYRKLTDI